MNTLELRKKLKDFGEKYNLTDFVKRVESYNENDVYINIAFLGEFKSGKTTLIDSLLGIKLLPRFDIPTTAIITEISKGEENTYKVIKKENNKIVNIESIDIAKEVINNEENQK